MIDDDLKDIQKAIVKSLTTVTPEELRAKQELKRRKQHEAWARWYKTKGAAYRQKRKEKKALNDSTPT